MDFATLLDFIVIRLVEHFNCPLFELWENGVACHFCLYCFLEFTLFNGPLLAVRILFVVGAMVEDVLLDFTCAFGRKNRFYPDFILTLQEKTPKSFDKILLIETKGGHLLGNTDTEYKRELTRLYQRKIQRSWSSNEAFPVVPKETIFRFVEEQNLENEMNEIFA